MCTLVYIKTLFWIYKTKLSTVKKLLITTMCIFAIKIVDFGNQKRKWTDPRVTNNNSISPSIYSVENLCKRFGQNKVLQNISLVCPNLTLNQLYFDDFL